MQKDLIVMTLLLRRNAGKNILGTRIKCRERDVQRMTQFARKWMMTYTKYRDKVKDEKEI